LIALQSVCFLDIIPEPLPFLVQLGLDYRYPQSYSVLMCWVSCQPAVPTLVFFLALWGLRPAEDGVLPSDQFLLAPGVVNAWAVLFRLCYRCHFRGIGFLGLAPLGFCISLGAPFPATGCHLWFPATLWFPG
jgi:hypothetical protein